MTPLTRRRLILYLGGTFVLGAIAGGAFGYGRAQRPPFKQFDRDAMRTKRCDSLVIELGLTPDQKALLDPILRQNMEEFDAVHREHFDQIDAVMKRARERIMAILTPEQQTKFEAMEREREQRRKKDGKAWPRRGDERPGGPPPSSANPTKRD